MWLIGNGGVAKEMVEVNAPRWQLPMDRRATYKEKISM